MEEVVIVSAVRTAVGRLGGGLKDVEPEDLGKLVIQEALARAQVEPEAVDEVILGQTKQSADAANLARVAMLKAGLPVEVPAYTVMRQCGSGLTAIHNAVASIMIGEADIVVAGGVENMSKAPYYLRGARYGYGAGNAVLVDSNTESQPRSQPIEIYGANLTMGLTAENLAVKYGISREEQDIFSLQSQERAFAAIESGRFKDEIVPVEIKQRKGTVVFDTDEHPRRSTLEGLAALPPVFKDCGTVTAGNASGRNDGAACTVVMSAKEASRRGLKPMVVIRGMAVAGVSPEIMGIGPAPASRKALKRAGLTLDDMGLIELNEAFAAQALAVIKDLDIGHRMADLNVNGGAIALGHPLGCSGARIFTTLLHEMKKRGTRYGLATLCIAGGQGIATVVEAV
ncbi:MAG: acetyl-CoA acetyltransferase [Actinobacteria bacterium RBG_16_64_13]|nr:MAG: acetyl-CoA acetyltransferase [Actinobacteria bacterium RBG_16_64_13]